MSLPIATTRFELASLAVQVAHWKGLNEPAFSEAKKILKTADHYLADPCKVSNRQEYDEVVRDLTQNLDGETLDESSRLKELKKFEEIINAINDAFVTRKRPAHPELPEPAEFPASRANCLRLITAEKDRRRRGPTMKAAGVQEKGEDLVGIEAYWGLALKVLPYLRKFGGKLPARRGKRIGKRDERGRIAKK